MTDLHFFPLNVLVYCGCSYSIMFVIWQKLEGRSAAFQPWSLTLTA